MTSVKHRAEHALRRVRLVPESRRDRVDWALALLGWFAVLAFAVLAIAPGLKSDSVFLGTSVMDAVSPWAIDDTPSTSVNLGIGDTVDSATPMALLITEDARLGDFAQWDWYTNGGTELAALPNSALLSPMSLAWWALPAHAANAGVKLTELLAIALGMSLLLRGQWRLPRVTAPVATLVFASSGFMVAWTNWPQTRVAALIPLFFWAVDRLAVDARLRNVVWFSLVLASMLLGGFPAVVAYSFYAGVPYFLVRAIAAGTGWRGLLMGLLRSALGTVVGAGLAAFQLVPFVAFSRTSIDLSARNFVGSHLPTETLASAIVPYLLGYPNGTHYSWPVHYIEGFSYLGAGSAVLIVVALVTMARRPAPRAVIPYLGIAFVLLTVMIFWGGPLLEIVQRLPMLGSSLFARSRSIWGFLGAALAGVGAGALLDLEPVGVTVRRLRGSGPGPIVAFLVRLALAMGVVRMLSLAVRSAQNPEEYHYSQMWIALALVVIGTLSLAVVVLWIGPTLVSGTVVVVVAIGLVAVPAIDVARNWWPISPSSTFYASTPTHSFLRASLGEDRYITVGQAMLPGTSTAYKLRAVTGHSFMEPTWRSALAAVSPAVFATATYTSLPTGSLTDGVLVSGILDRLGTKYVVAPENEVFSSTPEVVTTATTSTALQPGGGLRTASSQGPVRGIQIGFGDMSALASDNGHLTVALVSDATGEVLASTTIRLGGSAPWAIPVAGESIGQGESWHAELTLASTDAEVQVGTDSSGAVALTDLRPVADGLVLVHAGDALVFERTTALERVRWASSETVIADESQRLAQMESGAVPATSIVLEDASDATGSDGTSTATVTSTDTSADTMTVQVESSGPGWVVIADPLRDGGWSARLDGTATRLVNAEETGVAVYVPTKGRHTVTIEYTAPGFTTGRIMTAGTVVGMMVIGLWVILRRRHGRHGGSMAQRTDRSAAPEPAPRER